MIYTKKLGQLRSDSDNHKSALDNFTRDLREIRSLIQDGNKEVVAHIDDAIQQIKEENAIRQEKTNKRIKTIEDNALVLNTKTKIIAVIFATIVPVFMTIFTAVILNKMNLR